ncbi:TniQ family protein [Streptomyces nanshensis]|uniref:TniQ family protein n=1 Tax=Streptomyces nanshensis TaxID=518642 RepID=UPI00085BBC18|nr:TniQ family protein [Streptomyces nanshensis]
MTDRNNRAYTRAVRDYRLAHPGTSLRQAREAVAASSSRGGLPARLPAAPQPQPGEALTGYVKRAAGALGVGRHRAMELLGLQPGTSAARRLAELERELERGETLPDETVRALCAATGMTPAQAHTLTETTTPPPSLPEPATLDLETVRRHQNQKNFRPGGRGKTTTSLSAILAAGRALHPRTQLIDIDPQPSDADWQNGPDWPVRAAPGHGPGPENSEAAGASADGTGGPAGRSAGLFPGPYGGAPSLLSSRPGGEGRTSTSPEYAAWLARTLARSDRRALPVDTDPQHTRTEAELEPDLVDFDRLDFPGPAPSPWTLIDPPPGEPLPVSPELFDEIATKLQDGNPPIGPDQA